MTYRYIIIVGAAAANATASFLFTSELKKHSTRVFHKTRTSRSPVENNILHIVYFPQSDDEQQHRTHLMSPVVETRADRNSQPPSSWRFDRAAQ